jgi:quercetin dioxygenase-like cupin family protein
MRMSMARPGSDNRVRHAAGGDKRNLQFVRRARQQDHVEPARVPASEWQNPARAFGLLERKSLQTNITHIRYVTDVVGEGPTLHVHPYDEIFTITEDRARFTVGDRTIDAEAGDVVLGPANIPHGYQNLGPGRALTRWTFT